VTIAPSPTTDRLCYFPDILPTFAELAGAEPPVGIDGPSLAPTLRGLAEPTSHAFLDWEFNGWITIRQGDWRAVRPPQGATQERYDLKNDPGEVKDVGVRSILCGTFEPSSASFTPQKRRGRDSIPTQNRRKKRGFLTEIARKAARKTAREVVRLSKRPRVAAVVLRTLIG
jgi:hypothetical protein